MKMSNANVSSINYSGNGVGQAADGQTAPAGNQNTLDSLSTMTILRGAGAGPDWLGHLCMDDTRKSPPPPSPPSFELKDWSFSG
jgi:hypothetical protein